jgi:hypothetical protein
MGVVVAAVAILEEFSYVEMLACSMMYEYEAAMVFISA